MAMLFSTKKAAVKPVETFNRSQEALNRIFAEAEKALPSAAVNELISKGQKLVSAPNAIKEVVSENVAHQQMLTLSSIVVTKGPASKL